MRLTKGKTTQRSTILIVSSEMTETARPPEDTSIKNQLSTHLTLLPGSLQNSFLNCPLADQPVDSHLFRLTQPVCTVLCLLVHRGIPIRVVENNLKKK